MILFTFTLIAEFLVAFICFMVLRWALPKRPAAILVLIAALTGLTAGWVVGYRIARAQAWNSYYAQLNQDHRSKTGTDLNAEQFDQLALSLQDNADFLMALHKRAATHSIPSFVIVLVVLGKFAKRRKKNLSPEQ